MASVTVFVGDAESTYVVPVQQSDGILFTAVALRGADSFLHLSSMHPQVIERGRMVVSALTQALDQLEDAMRRRAVVPIASLAPDLPPAA